MKPEILVRAFVLHQSEDAFRELVAGTVDEVFSRALRLVQGPPHLVEETVLRVYWELARQATGLGEEVVLANWLRDQTYKTAVRVLHEEDRCVDRAALRVEKLGLSTPSSSRAAPPGLATCVSQSILLNAARRKNSRRLLPRVSWPAWIRPVPVAAVAVCVLGIVIFCNIPFRRRNPIVQAPEMQMTPASYGQLAISEDGGVSRPPSRTNAEGNRNQP
jgi:hypothetical protein